MARLRYNNAIGTLGASLTSGGTTITFAAAPPFTTLTGSDYVPLVIDPPATSPNATFEIVYLTAYTAGATTGTILRGQETTSAAAHASGAAWVCGPTKYDLDAIGVPPSRAYRSAAFTLVTGLSKIPVDTSSFDSAGNFDVATNHRYNVPASGFYHVEAQITPTPQGSQTYVPYVYKNGVAVAKGNQAFTSGTGVIGLTVSEVVPCVAGDYLELWVSQGGTSTPLSVADSNAANYMTVTPLGGTNYATPTQPSYQNGVLNSGDAALSGISLSTSTGAITFTAAAANPLWVQNTAGLVVPALLPAGAQTLTPAALPASGSQAVYGVEVDVNGALYLVKGTDTATVLSTGLLIAANTPAITSGRLRIADFALKNASGTINFSNSTTTASPGVNWIDRRPWARGAFYKSSITAGNYSVSTAGLTALDTTRLQLRVECTGNPIRISLLGRMQQGGGGDWVTVLPWVDGVIPAELGTSTNPYGMIMNFSSGADLGKAMQWAVVPTAGSHLITMAGESASVAGTLFASDPALEFIVEEIVRQNAANGTA